MGHSNTSTSVENLHLSTSDDPEISDRVVVEVRNAKGGLLDLRGLNLGRDRSEKKYGYIYIYYIYIYMYDMWNTSGMHSNILNNHGSFKWELSFPLPRLGPHWF